MQRTFEKPLVWLVAFLVIASVVSASSSLEKKTETCNQVWDTSEQDSQFYCDSFHNETCSLSSINSYSCWLHWLPQNSSTPSNIASADWGWHGFQDPIPTHPYIKIAQLFVSLTGIFTCSVHNNSFVVVISNTSTPVHGQWDVVGVFNITSTNIDRTTGKCCANCMTEQEIRVPSLPSPKINFYNRGGMNYLTVKESSSVFGPSSPSPSSRDLDFDDDDDFQWQLCIQVSSIQVGYYDELELYIVLGGIILTIFLIVAILLGITLYYKRRVSNLQGRIRSINECTPLFCEPDDGKKKEVSSSSSSLNENSDILIDTLPNYQISDLYFIKSIGRGTFGDIYLANSDQYGRVAVKRISFSSLNDANIEKRLRDSKKEIDIMSRLRHPNILTFYGATKAAPNIFILMEFMERGSLHDVLLNPDITLTVDTKKTILLGAARGMSYLHACSPKIIHRDLKSHNLLLDRSLKCKIADFGLSRIIDSEETGNDLTMVGTPCWTAPEILRHEAYDEKCDTFSFGIVIWETFTRLQPYADRTAAQVILAVVNNQARPPPMPSIPPGWQRLMEDCWHENPSFRPSFDEIVNRIQTDL